MSRHANARFTLGCAIHAVRWTGEEIEVATSKGPFRFDFLMLSTGFRIDWHARPEFAAIAPHVRSWGDRYAAPPAEEDGELADSPDLGRAFELNEKTPGACPGLDRVHCFCFPAALSHGTVSGDIPAISDGATRLAQGMAGLFYDEDIDIHYARMQAFAEPEVFGDEWTPAGPPGA